MKLAATILVTCVGALLSLGLVMSFSAGMKPGGGEYPLMPLAWSFVGVVLAVVAAGADYRWLKKGSWLLLAAAIGLLVAVLLVGKETKGAQRWLSYGGVSFQPSELAKLALIVALAHYGERFQRVMPTLRGGLLLPASFIGLVLLLIFKEPDWGTTVLLGAVSGIMLLVAGVRWWHMVPAALVGAAGLLLLLLQNPTRLRRIGGWLDLEGSKQDVGYQTWQSLLALGSGGWTGVGLGGSLQKYGYVPEHQTDFILPVIGEELGLVFTLGVVVAFVLIVLCGVYIARRARDRFGLLLGTGLTFLIGLQAFINIAVVTNVLPNKGLPLPFISRGGSNLVILLAAVGLLLSIARRALWVEAPAPQEAEVEELPAAQSA